MEEKKTVLLGMSGGIDSSISAYLLKQKGYRVIGVTMQTYNEDEPNDSLSLLKSGCYGPAAKNSILSAQKLAETFSIEHHVIPLYAEFQREVLDYFRSEYLKGRTPNPCVRCNQMLKFGFLMKYARNLGIDFDYFATGHYCRIEKNDDGIFLKKALDPKKDQTYFLSRLKKEQLENLIFPLGELSKDDVREIARELNLRELLEKSESQDFIAADSYSVLFKPEDGVAGEIHDLSGKVIGHHKGLINYTIGQRRGVGLGGAAQPLYVVGIDTEKNVLTVGDKEALLSSQFHISDPNWFIDLERKPSEFTSQVKIRQTARAVNAMVSYDKDSEVFRVKLMEPQSAVTPGQIAVFYDGDILIGSGIIERD